VSDYSVYENGQSQLAGNARQYKRDFWDGESGKFAEPHFRMRKAARVVRRLTGGRACDVLDLGCGPAAFGQLMPGNVRYYGIDIAIQDPAPNLIEMDMLETPISFRDMKFDVILAQGVFEYFGRSQSQKFAEIRDSLKADGKFVVTYTNFAHIHKNIYHAYSNVQQQEDFRRGLRQYFVIERSFPGSHNWNHSMPKRKSLQLAQARFDINVPVLSPMLAVDFFYICRPMRRGS
jgi:SAM-dependent methyltransferase